MPFVNPDGLIWTLSELGVAPCVGVTTSQLLPHEVVAAEALKLTFAPVLLVTMSVWAAGPAWPIWNANDNCDGDTSSVGVPAIVTRTGTLTPFVPGGLMAIAPLKVPEPLIAPGFTVTCNDPGMLPDVGAAVNQFPPPFIIGVAV